MPHRGTIGVVSAIITIIAACLTIPACGNNDDAPNQEARAKKKTPSAVKVAKIHVGKCTLKGAFREFNEDGIYTKVSVGSTICLVTDGMGAKVDKNSLGQIACQRVIKVLSQELEKEILQTAKPADIRKSISRVIVAANEDVIGYMRMGAINKSMGTTVVLALWHAKTGMYVAGVGDSRAYLVRGEKIKQLTVDHSLAQALVENGTISVKEAKTHRFRNVLWKYLGSKEVGNAPEVKFISVQPVDRILLCTDGIHAAIADDEIFQNMNKHADVQQCAEGLCQFALSAGSRDNVACIVIELVGPE